MNHFLIIKKTILFVGIFAIISSPAFGVSFQEITIEAGDTLWSISNKYLKDPKRWPEIVKHNKLNSSDPTVPLPGTKIKVPVTLIKEEFQEAVIVNLVPDVRYKKKKSSSWKMADESIRLRYEDSLRTLEGGMARVRFPSNETIEVNENSYIVLKPEKYTQEINLLEGNVRASKAKVILPQGTVINSRDRSSDYIARVRKDKSEVVFVYKGRVDVTAQGKTVTVKEGFGTHVPKQKPPSAPKPLAEFPDFELDDFKTPLVAQTAPRSRTISNPPPVNTDPPVQKQPSRSRTLVSDDLMANYRLQIATDKEFKNIILDHTKPTGQTFDIKDQKINDGFYYMRVAFFDQRNRLGPFSEPTLIEKDTVPPKFESLNPPNGKVIDGPEAFAEFKGILKGATLLAINEEVIFIDNEGNFQKFFPLVSGDNIFEIFAEDVNGNKTTVKRKIIYRQIK